MDSDFEDEKILMSNFSNLNIEDKNKQKSKITKLGVNLEEDHTLFNDLEELEQEEINKQKKLLYNLEIQNKIQYQKEQEMINIKKAQLELQQKSKLSNQQNQLNSQFTSNQIIPNNNYPYNMNQQFIGYDVNNSFLSNNNFSTSNSMTAFNNPQVSYSSQNIYQRPISIPSNTGIIPNYYPGIPYNYPVFNSSSNIYPINPNIHIKNNSFIPQQPQLIPIQNNIGPQLIPNVPIYQGIPFSTHPQVSYYSTQNINTYNDKLKNQINESNSNLQNNKPKNKEMNQQAKSSNNTVVVNPKIKIDQKFEDSDDDNDADDSNSGNEEIMNFNENSKSNKNLKPKPKQNYKEENIKINVQNSNKNKKEKGKPKQQQQHQPYSMSNINDQNKLSINNNNMEVSNVKQKLDFNTLSALINSFHSSNDFVDYICTPKGCRNIQNYLSKISTKMLNLLIETIGFDFYKIMTNSFANYFFQRFTQCCNFDQRLKIINYIKAKISEISHDSSGTHALQALLEVVNSDEEISLIVKSIESDFLNLCRGLNSNHVIQKIIASVQENRRVYLNDMIINYANILIYDANGVCVLKKLLLESLNSKAHCQIWERIKEDLLEIIQNPFGNYIVQLLLELSANKEITNSIIEVVTVNISVLAVLKISSNVVERCIEISSKDQKTTIFKILFNISKVLGFLKNKFSKFVIKKAISLMEPDNVDNIIKSYESRWNEINPKDQKKLNSLIDKMYSVKYVKSGN